MDRGNTCSSAPTARALQNKFCEREESDLREAEVVQLVVPSGNDLVFVDPDVAITGEHIDVGARFPVGMGLRAVGIAESDVHTGKFFVL